MSCGILTAASSRGQKRELLLETGSNLLGRPCSLLSLRSWGLGTRTGYGAAGMEKGPELESVTGCCHRRDSISILRTRSRSKRRLTDAGVSAASRACPAVTVREPLPQPFPSAAPNFLPGKAATEPLSEDLPVLDVSCKCSHPGVAL